MPLPAALAARLAKRGILAEDDNKKDDVKQGDNVDEEVFAEDYDEPEATPPPSTTVPFSSESDHMEEDMEAEDSLHGDDEEEEEDDRLIHQCPACPNRSNLHHECSEYCQQRWGFKQFESEPDMDRKRLKMLKKFPLPDSWEEVGDPQSGRYYYWNTDTDEVSWLPPTHPRMQISLPAERLQELLQGSRSPPSPSEDEDEGDIMDIDDFEEIERKILMEKSVKEKEKSKKEKRRREEPLDPMDPAAYSDIQRGTWSTGLDTRGSAKTGVDATASGPLYQQRPYPSPGAILRMNKDSTE